MASCLLTSQELSLFIRKLRQCGCNVVRDRSAGTVEVRSQDEVVMRAIQKSRNGPWIAWFTATVTIQWGNRNTISQESEEK
jgi:hypothetical protein